VADRCQRQTKRHLHAPFNLEAARCPPGELGARQFGQLWDNVRAWQHSVDSIITVGRLIAEAKAELRHGEFSAKIRADLPFGPRTARRLMAVAQHPVIAKGTHASVLPPSWTTSPVFRWPEVLLSERRYRSSRQSSQVQLWRVGASCERCDALRELRASP
jgi:hypothetical protein